MRKFVKINNNNIKNTIKRHYSSELKNELSHLIPEKRERLNKIKFLLNDKVIDNVSANQLIGGMRGIKCMLWDNSSLDSEKGITLVLSLQALPISISGVSIKLNGGLTAFNFFSFLDFDSILFHNFSNKKGKSF